MKNWLKQQVTEVSAWAGFIICASVFFTPDWVTFLIGAFLISINDEKAAAFVRYVTPWMHKKIDQSAAAVEDL